MSTEPVPCAAPCATRRAVLAAAGAVGAAGVTAALTGCQTYGNESAAPPPSPAPASSSSKPPAAVRTKPPAAKTAKPTEPADAGPPPLAKVSDIPVGGGKIFTSENVVLTQPTPGKIKAFSTVCTHQGCPVTEVGGGTINCPCHGSRFKISDGSVAGGPARRPLPEVAVKVQGGAVRLA